LVNELVDNGVSVFMEMN